MRGERKVHESLSASVRLDAGKRKSRIQEQKGEKNAYQESMIRNKLMRGDTCQACETFSSDTVIRLEFETDVHVQ